MAGRPSYLDDPEQCYAVATAFAEGCTREEMCDLFGIKDTKTITKWRRDPRVTTIQRRIVQDRILAITSKTDTELARRLQNPEDLTTKELLEIRKEFLGGKLRDQAEDIDESTVAEAQSLIESNPDVADQLRRLLAQGAKGARAATAEERQP